MAERKLYQYGGNVGSNVGGSGTIDMGAFRQIHEKSRAAKKIAKETKKQRGKAGFLGGLFSALTPLLNIAGKGILKFLGIVPGVGMLTPLLQTLITGALKHTGQTIAQGLGMGADPSKIKADNKYGYGQEYAKTLSEGLEKNISSQMGLSGESLIPSAIMNYVSALTPKLTVKDGKEEIEEAKLFKKGEKPTLFGFEDKGLIPEIKHEGDRKKMMELINTTEGVAPDTTEDFTSMISDIYDRSSPVGAGYTEIGGFTPEGYSTALDPSGRAIMPLDPKLPETILQKLQLPERQDVNELQQSLQLQNRLRFDSQSPLQKAGFFQQGGQVPTTIEGFFEAQGKSLGGSSKKSIAEMLGRK